MMGSSQSTHCSDRNTQSGTFVDLFAGCGGLTLGLLNSGWRGLFGIEVQQDAFSTYSANFINGERHSVDWPDWLEKKAWDIKKLLAKHETDLYRLKGSVDLVCGGPPCQGFSFSGQRDPNDPRNQMFRRYVDFVGIVQPKLLLLENVPGFNVAHGKSDRSGARVKSKSYATKLRALLETSYVFDDCLIRASRFGVPQVRDRYFAIGIRRDLAGEVEDGWAGSLIENERASFLESKGLPANPISARLALCDLEIKSRKLIPYKRDESCNSPSCFSQVEYKAPRHLNKYMKVMRGGFNGEEPNSRRLPRHSEIVAQRFQAILSTCPKGKNISMEAKKGFGIKKARIIPLAPNDPAKTITTLPDDILHYSEPRILTVRECARLQSFPDWFTFHGKYTTGGQRRKIECPRYTQVGNAVPPLVAEAWGVALAGLIQNAG